MVKRLSMTNVHYIPTNMQISVDLLILMWLCSGQVYPDNPVEDFVMEVNTRLVTLSLNSISVYLISV